MKRTIVISGEGYLFLKRRQLLLRKKDIEITVAPLEDIGLLVLESSACSVSIPVLQLCAEYNTGVIICGKDFMPVMQALPFDGHHQVTGRLKLQVNWTEPFKKRAWQQIIRAKIANQGAVLQYNLEQDFGLRFMAQRVNSGDTSNLEAQASRRYWSALFGRDFRRQPQGAWPNAMLNYGYAILRSSTARALAGVGLHPSIGIFHKRKDNTYCLADDLMEPFRPFIDWQVRQTYETLPTDQLNRDHKQILFEVLQADTEVDGESRPVSVAIETLASSLAQSTLLGKPLLKTPELPMWTKVEESLSVEKDEN